MRRACPALIATFAVLGVTACGADGTAPEASAQTSEAGQTDDRSATMVVGIPNLPFYLNGACSAEKVLTAEGVDFDYQESQNFDASLQIPVVQSAIAASPDVLLLAPTDSTALVAPVQEAVDAGIKVILFDTTIDTPEIADGEVITDNAEGGRAAAEETNRLLAGKTGTVALLTFQPGNTVTDDRQAGFVEAFEEDGGLRLEPSTPLTGIDDSEAANIAQGVIASTPDLVAIVGVNATAVRGANQALLEAGREDLVVGGFDIDPAFGALVKDGQLDFIVGINAVEEGRVAGEMALTALRGEENDPVRVDPIMMTQENADEALGQVYGCTEGS
jgi:ribose transport system substrate-binding protein